MSRTFRLTAIVLVTQMFMGAGLAADMELPPSIAVPRPATGMKDIPVQQNQPNCSRWTDECVSCVRGADNEPAICSNIGFACQPKPIRCLSGDTPQNDPRE